MRIIEGIIYGFFYSVLACGVLMYILRYFPPAETEPPTFELAIVSAVIGGFALSGGFLDKASAGLQRNIKCIGALYLGAAIAFIVFALVIPMAAIVTSGAAYWIVYLANLISMFVAMLFFALATGWLIAKLPKIFQEFCFRK